MKNLSAIKNYLILLKKYVYSSTHNCNFTNNVSFLTVSIIEYPLKVIDVIKILTICQILDAKCQKKLHIDAIIPLAIRKRYTLQMSVFVYFIAL